VRRELSRVLEGLWDQAVERVRHERSGPGKGKLDRWGCLVRRGVETTWGRLEVRLLWRGSWLLICRARKRDNGSGGSRLINSNEISTEGIDSAGK
jgi:hypothetical protein